MQDEASTGNIILESAECELDVVIVFGGSYNKLYCLKYHILLSCAHTNLVLGHISIPFLKNLGSHQIFG